MVVFTVNVTVIKEVCAETIGALELSAISTSDLVDRFMFDIIKNCTMLEVILVRWWRRYLWLIASVFLTDVEFTWGEMVRIWLTFQTVATLWEVIVGCRVMRTTKSLAKLHIALLSFLCIFCFVRRQVLLWLTVMMLIIDVVMIRWVRFSVMRGGIWVVSRWIRIVTRRIRRGVVIRWWVRRCRWRVTVRRWVMRIVIIWSAVVFCVCICCIRISMEGVVVLTIRIVVMRSVRCMITSTIRIVRVSWCMMRCRWVSGVRC